MLSKVVNKANLIVHSNLVIFLEEQTAIKNLLGNFPIVELKNYVIVQKVKKPGLKILLRKPNKIYTF
jgi:hypothetical protein